MCRELKDRGETDEDVDNLSEHRTFTEDHGDQIHIKRAYEQPIESSDNEEGKGYHVYRLIMHMLRGYVPTNSLSTL